MSEKYDDKVSSWDWCVERSAYHFNHDHEDEPGEWFRILGKFQDDWSDELATLDISELSSITWATRKYSPFYDKDDGAREQSKMLAQEEYDLIATGAGVNLQLTDVIEKPDFGPILTKMSEFFGLENVWGRLHIQRPGQMFNYHIDKLWDHCPEDPGRVCRILIFLTDWEPGQFFCHGTHTLAHWKAGTAITFDWANVPHASANASRHDRPLMILTGLTTDKTNNILSNATESSVYQL
jgi:hypothetical protein